VHASGTVHVTVRGAVELGRVGFERLRAELLDIYRDWRCGRSISNCAGVPSGFLKRGSWCFVLALLDVTKGEVFWIVALGPAKWAIRALPVMMSDLL
jgi:hypothetical protein